MKGCLLPDRAKQRYESDAQQQRKDGVFHRVFQVFLLPGRQCQVAYSLLAMFSAVKGCFTVCLHNKFWVLFICLAFIMKPCYVVA